MGLCASGLDGGETTRQRPAGGSLGAAHSALDDAGPKGTAGTASERELLTAAAAGETARVKALLDRGVDVNFGATLPNTPTALLEAVKHKQKEVVTLLLSRGARVDPVYLQKMNALHVAARGKANAILGMLLSEPGVASVINDRDQGGRTVLFYVASGKDRDLYAMLVGMGADETIPDSSGTTARAKAIQNGLVDA
ncbi:hypothetical protein FNF27_03539 [Cafeteria roenbergensis]|uniref:Uncharacterized protein n=1 Tax=Cafeteria roenbergensis TaxID=33653 RepID=A0A5A8CNP5_CAFRO|nr:hypothetical protein FNF29_02265 [Cafeteria roenbergensis]KAA0175008.1 hypothetical protein FNF27_03539 [Cafeteria roenbergensis]|eukprot:KAA0154736.1 hypothetical protein FNF29_02265 [Cafeteria roenbergensis]